MRSAAFVTPGVDVAAVLAALGPPHQLPVARTLVEATLYVIDTEGVRTDKALAAIREEVRAG